VPFLGDPRDLDLGTKVEKGHIPDSVITRLKECEVELVRAAKQGAAVFMRGPVVKDNMKYRAVYFVPRDTLKRANYNKAKVDFRNPVFTIEEEK